MRFLILTLLCVFAFALSDASFPGGAAIAPLGAFGETAPLAFYRDRRVRVDKLPNGEWAAIVGVSIDAKPNTVGYVSYRTIEGKTGTVSFKIGKKEYPVQRLTIDKSMEALDEKTLQRVAKERETIARALAEFSETFKGETQMRAPLIAPISSQFGMKRIINQTPRRPHSGTDLAAPKGTPILAPSDGVTALADNHFYCGNFVLLNHGEGLFTLYCHLDRGAVTTGREVKTGDTIGYVGATGRVTGAHLHWSAALNGAWFDPLLLVSGDDLAKLKPKPQSPQK
ncbi:MAG: peptidoglycan DD-metalloendopeptidase family protein [Helicobacteraceae bacterium]|jgi:murein DD-endopeptidase MepM/ murein hydrolase activator NlpD|nr:peptidoglycan DD-metalloendopeptidase family protein [Helicobacteraceae bacterium]